jgi:hypothetical protein
MLQKFQFARVIDAGNYEIAAIGGGIERYPWVELVQRADDLRAVGDAPRRDSTGPQRFSVDREAAVAFDGVPFGTLIEGWFEVSDQTKVIKGTDRSVDKMRLQLVGWREIDAAGKPVRLVEPEPAAVV